jgi:hypothetical protein
MLNTQSSIPKAQSPEPEHGVAIIIVLLIMAALGALGTTLALLTSTERRVTATYRDGMEVLYAANAALEAILLDVAAETDVNQVLAGMSTSAFVDGPPGPRRFPDGTTADLRRMTAVLNCAKPACSDTDLVAESEDRPWGKNNPRWQIYAHGRLDEMFPGPATPQVYVIVWIVDDPSENDDQPLIDGDDSAGENPGRDRISILVHAYGLSGTRRIIEAAIARAMGGVRVLSWRENP